MNNGTISSFIDNIASLMTRCVCPGGWGDLNASNIKKYLGLTQLSQYWLVRDTENIVTTFKVTRSVTAPYKKMCRLRKS